MALTDMVSQFQPANGRPGNGLAGGTGLDGLTNAGSELNIDSEGMQTTGLAEGKGLEGLTNAGSDLNIDSTPVATTGIANLAFTGNKVWDGSYGGGTGIQGLGAGTSMFDINGISAISDGIAKGK